MERLAFILHFTLLAGASWALGGRAEGAYWVIGLGGMLLLTLALVHRAEWMRQSEEWEEGAYPRLGPSHLLPWVGLLLLLIFALLNPAYEQAPTGSMLEGSLIEQKHKPGLPSVVLQERSLRFSVLFVGVLCQAAALFILAHRRMNLRLLLAGLLANAGVLAIVGGYFRLRESEQILGRIDWVNTNFYATFRYHNHWGAYAILGIGAALALFAWYRKYHRAEGRQINPAWIALLFGLLLCISLPLARGRLTTLLGLGLLFAGLLIAFLWSGRGRRWLQVLTVSIILIPIGFFTYRTAAPELDFMLQKTLKQMPGHQNISVDLRLAFTRDAARMGADKPVFGWGLGSFLYGFRLYAGDEFHTQSGGLPRMEFAHNDWIQYWVELGTVGILLLLWPAGTLLYFTLRHGRANPISLSLGAACLLIALMALVEFPLGNPAVFLHFTCFFALACKYALLESRRAR